MPTENLKTFGGELREKSLRMRLAERKWAHLADHSDPEALVLSRVWYDVPALAEVR
jgi:hypothetical protein